MGLSFEGSSGKRLTDPFLPPSGTYRVNFTIEGFGDVEIIPLQDDDGDLIFNLSRGRAKEGASLSIGLPVKNYGSIL